MRLTSILGASLKDPSVIEILEYYDSDVVYDFDRLSEGQQDVYWASCRPGGLLLKFDEHQTMVTAFLYVRGNEEYAPCSLSEFEIEKFDSIEAANSFANKHGLSAVSRDLGPKGPQWIRIDMGDHSVHYEFGDNGLGMVTLMLSEVVPG